MRERARRAAGALDVTGQHDIAARIIEPTGTHQMPDILAQVTRFPGATVAPGGDNRRAHRRARECNDAHRRARIIGGGGEHITSREVFGDLHGGAGGGLVLGRVRQDGHT